MNRPSDMLGSIVRKMRLESHMSLREFAGELGIGVSTLSRWENGLFLPNVQNLEALQRFAPGWGEELHSLWKEGRYIAMSHYRGCRR